MQVFNEFIIVFLYHIQEKDIIILEEGACHERRL